MTAEKGMDIRQNRETWNGFIKLTQWVVGLVVVLLILMAIFLV